MTADDLKQAIRQLSPLPDVSPDFSWLGRRIALRRRILKDDPEEFLTWSVIIGTMFVGNAPYISKEMSNLELRYYDAIFDPGFGNPAVYDEWNDDEIITGNLIHQAYHLAQWEEKTGKHIENLNQIEEFGGGYGAMALICNRLGFGGIYSIQDFPEFSLLQRYYLSNVLDDIGNIQFSHPPAYPDLYIALWSISEVPPVDRRIPNADSYLFAYAPNWDGYSNQDYFGDFIKGKPDYKWWNWQIDHLPNSWYLVGVKDG